MTGWPARAWLLVPIGAGLAVGLVVAKVPLAVVALAAAAVLAMLGLARPRLLVAGMFLALLFDRLGLTSMKVAQFPVTASKLSVLGSLGLWAVHVTLNGKAPVRWHPVLTAMLGAVAVCALCVALTGSLGPGKFTLFGLGMMTVLVALVYTILAPEDLQPLYRFLGVALTLALVASVVASGGAGEAGRASGTYGDPNEWATTVLLLTPLVLGGLADEEHRGWGLMRPVLVLLASASVLLSASRTALVVGAVVAVGCVALLWHRKGEILAAGAVAVVGVPFFVDMEMAVLRFRSLVDNLTGASVVPDQSLNERTELLQQGLALFRDNWLYGSGPGTFARATGFVTVDGRLRPAHNTFLEIAAEQGVLGLGATGLFILVVGLSLWRAWRASEGAPSRRVLGAGLGLSAVGLMAAALGLITFSMAYLALGIGLAAALQAEHG